MGLRRFFQRRNEDADLERELDAHLAHQVDENISAGMSADEARRQAYLKLGSPRRVREDVWQWNTLQLLEDLLQDIRYALRRLRSNPGFTVVSVLTLALGIGASAAIFSALNPILFASLPYPQARQIMALWETAADRPHSYGTFGMYRNLAERNRSFESMAVLAAWQPTITGEGQPERLEGQRVSASYFHVLGIAPSRGRDFKPSDDRMHGPKVVIISHALWRRRFAADPAVLGRSIILNEDSYQVIGIMPVDFENVLSPTTEVWTPLQYGMSEGRAWGHHLRTVGRLRPGVNAQQAAQELNLLGTAVLQEQQPETYGREVRFSVSSLQADVTRGVKPALLAVLGAVLLVLVIACVNVANLFLARGVQRRGEFALRVALGAARDRVVRQLLTESLLLAMIGGVAGMALAFFGVRALVALSPPGLPRTAVIGLDGSVFAFGLGITTLAGLAFGLFPAIQAARSDLQSGLQASTRHTAGTQRRTRSALVVAEVSLALVLLVSSGLLLRSLERLFAVDAGFDGSHVLTMQVQTAGHRYSDKRAVHSFFQESLRAVQSVPGVTAAALTSQLPLSGDVDEYGAGFAATPVRAAASYSVFRYAVSPGYLETMRIPLRSGRLLGERDGEGAPLAAVISESLARTRFAGADPLGERLQLGPYGPYTIVGVVGNVKQMSLTLSETDAVYIPMDQWPSADGTMSLVVRARGDAGELAGAVRNSIWSVDKDQPIFRLATLDDLLAASEAQRHFALILFELFALAALALAAAGIYGVLSGSVAERVREIGIRAALGASRRSILEFVLRQGMTLTGAGICLGLIGSVAASRALITLLFGVSRLDPVTYLGVIVLLLIVSAMACWVPAWRASRVDPMTALRHD
jgi:putative ABC transport system permease protein